MSIHVDVLAELNERKARQVADQLERRFGDIDVAIAAHVNEADMKAAAAKLHRQFDDIKVEVKADVDHAGFQRANRAIRSTTNEAKNLHGVLEEIGTTAFKTSRGLTTIAAPVIVKGLVDFVQVATQATQSLWLLPAAATAAGAAISTLSLATSGFADTVKEVRDPEKFAEAIQGISPAAQQAALSIQNLLPQFDALKNATQDAFFKGFGEQINRLATTYLPTIQNLTTSIATSFNNMITNVADQLMTPDTQAAMQTTFANISQMFTNLEPVAGSLTRAFTDIAEVGSGFLPGLATEIANAATSFENFIAQARASGDLARWIQEGIDAVKNLGAAAIELVQIFYRVFGPDTTSNISGIHTGIQSLDDTIQSYNADLRKTSEIIGLVTLDTKTWATTWNDEMVSMQGPLGSLRDGILDIPEALAVAFNAVKHVFDDMLTNFAADLNHMADILPDKANKFLFGTEHPKPFSFTPLPDAPPGGDWRGYTDTRGIPGGGGPGAQRQRRGAPPLPGQTPMPGDPYPGPFGVPPNPPDKGNQLSDKDRLDAIKAGLDPSLYKVADPFAPIPGLPDPYAAPPGAVQGVADPQQVFEAQQRVIAEAHDLEEDRKNRLALERDNESTAEEIADAKWKELEDANALQKAQADLGDKMRGTAKDVKAGSDELSAALDPDLGLGRGLAGLADNLVRFMGHMALAGSMAKWQQTINNQEATTGITGGYGFFGMRGEKNLSQGLSPLLGRPMPGGAPAGVSPGTYTPGVSTGGLYPSASSPTLGSGASYGLPAGTNTGGYGTGTSSTFPPWVMALGQQFGVKPSTYAGHQESNRNEPGYAPNPQHLNRGIDWSGTPEAMQRFAQAMAGNPLAEQVIFNGPGGPVEAIAGQQRPGYFAGDLAAHGTHVHTRFAQDPTGAGTPGGMPGGATGGYTTAGGLPIPLPVTIVGMGAGGGGGIPGLPGATPGGGGVPGQSLWDKVAQAESSGNWQNADTGGSGHYGGLQFSPETWKAYGGTGMPNQATREQQIEIANRAAFTGYNGTPPQGLKAWEAITKGMVPGVTTATPATAFGLGAGTPAPAAAPNRRPPSPGKPGFIPGIGYVDSNGNPTGYNPGGGKPPGVPGAGEAGPFGRGTMPPLNGPGGGTPLPHPNEPSILPDTALYPTGPPRIPGGGGPGAQRERRGAPPLMPKQYGPPGAGTGGAPTSMIGPFALPSSVARNAPPGGPLPVNPTQNGVPTGPDAFMPSAGGPGIGPTQIGSLAPPDSTNPGGEGFGIMPGGTISSAISGAADFGGFGGGAAAQTLMKLANRTIQYGGEMAGHAVEGLMQTFLPTGGSELAQNSWLTRMIGGISAAAPALPNMAGGELGQQQMQGPLTPGDVSSGQGTGPAPGPGPINIVQNNNNGLTSAEQAANSIADHVRTANAGTMAGAGAPPR